MRVTETTTREVDLGAIPYEQWPEDAKRLARALLSQPMVRRGISWEFPSMRHSWLAARVERVSRALEDI